MEIYIQAKNIGTANVDCSWHSLKGFQSKTTPCSRRLIVKLYTLCKTQDLENHTLFSGTYPYGPNKRDPPPPQTSGMKDRNRETAEIERKIYDWKIPLAFVAVWNKMQTGDARRAQEARKVTQPNSENRKKNLAYKPFPSSKNSHSDNEKNWRIFLVKMSFSCMRMKNHFEIKSFALSFALKRSLAQLGKGLLCWYIFLN